MHRSKFVLAGSLLALAATTARANGVNVVQAITFQAAPGGKTVVTVRGSSSPSFTAYRLEEPPRVVVDMADCQMGKGVGDVVKVDTQAVGQISLQHLHDEADRTLITVLLRKGATYDVKAKGNEVVVTVTPGPGSEMTAPSTVAAPPPSRPEPARKAEVKRETAPRPIVTTLSPTGRGQVQSIEFQDQPDAARVVITAPSAEFSLVGTPSTSEPVFSLRLRNSDLPERLARTLDASAYRGPVASVSTFPDPDEKGAVRVVVKLTGPTSIAPRLHRDGAAIVWDFPKATVMGNSPPTRIAPYGVPTLPMQIAPPSAQPQSRTLPGVHKRYSGAAYDYDFKDIDIHNMLRVFARIGNVNIVTTDEVKGNVTVSMHNVPWDQALDVVLRSKGLGQVREGNVIRVAPHATLEKEREAEALRTKQVVELKPLITKLVPLSYADANKMQQRVQDVLSPRGHVSFDERTNTMIITDISGNLALAEDLIHSLDTQTPQVLIEARVVEARTNFLREIGIQWGGGVLSSAATGNPTGLVFPSTIGAAGGSQDQFTNTNGLLGGQAASPNYVVNLPAPVGTNSGGALGLTLGSVNGAVNINLRLSALENTGNIRIISAPKITSLDNVESKIEQGVAIPVTVTSALGPNTIFVDAALSLTVKPHITNEGSVIMYVDIKKNEPDFSNTGTLGTPTILKKQAKTQMLVRDGDTAVIGGIYTRNTSVSYNKVPWLAEIPILGWFFKHRAERDDRTELLIFITPRIVNRTAPAASTASR